ncbi:type II CAAX prenyl endopeptidase Rce1 family protein [Luteimonas sp. WGS1318]|uniref:CPBP family glutamic-type intramembrane protease n=1 Tax=Luteimonas sp. WGS1318 TaxID=3366815 RepID=UPI00372D0CA3
MKHEPDPKPPHAPRPAFPYVDGDPAPIGPGGGLAIIGACAAAFAALSLLPQWLPGAIGTWAGATAFVALQLLGLVIAVGPAWTALFRRPRARDLLIALACVPLVFAVPAAVALGVVGDAHLVENEVIARSGTLPPSQLLTLFAASGLQLLGEELVTILPLLVLMAVLRRAGLGPWWVIVIGWLVTSLIFGALHLPTYQWHWGQALLVIGSARVVLTGVYLLTRNLWASTLAHVVNDWSFLMFALLMARMSVHGG